jgi:hypothetical protein
MDQPEQMTQINQMNQMTQIERIMVEYYKKTLGLKVKNIKDNQKYHKLVEKILSYTNIPQDLYKYIKLYVGYRPINIHKIPIRFKEIKD